MAVKDNSDYTKLRTKLYDLVPEVNKSDTNRAVFGNLFDRYMTKQESTHTVGYVGDGNPNAIISRQINEPTLHRQGHQLQPILRSKIGSVEHMASWEDLRNEYERLGVDIEQFDEWGKVLQFNWIPPIDIDKLTHYEDYYWFDESNTSSNPEYITIRSRGSTAVANANFWESLVDTYGSDFPIAELLADDNPSALPEYSIFSLVPASDEVTVEGNSTPELQIDQYFNIEGTVNNDGIYKVTSSPVYDTITGRTTFTVESGAITVLESVTGTITMRRFNRLRLSGEYHRLLEPGFVFFIRETLNEDLNNAFWQSESVEFDEGDTETIVTLASFVTDDTQGGVISLQESLDFYLAEKACQCSGGIGWDILQWDDTPADPTWEGDFDSLITAISNPEPPLAPGTSGELWYDTTNDKFYQYSTDTANWKLLYNNFSLVIDSTEGFALWDYTEDCGAMTRVPSASQWTSTNLWLHKSDVPNFSKAKQATLPILEFDWDLELNEWTLTKQNWKYRTDKFETFTDSTIAPSIIELQELLYWEADGDDIVLDDRYGDLTSFFTPGSTFQATSPSESYEVERSVYMTATSGQPYRTIITLTEALPLSLSTGTFDPLSPSSTPLRPVKTAHGDFFKEYGDHWLYVESDNTIPTVHQADNPFVFPDLSFVTIIHPDYDYELGYGSQVYTVTSIPPVFSFIFDPQVLVGTTRPLNERALAGANNVRVYINDIRQYGTYAEDTHLVPDVNLNDVSYVSGITFFANLGPSRFDEVRIEVGEAAVSDLGNYAVSVRTIEDNIAYAAKITAEGYDQYVSLTEYRRAEQVKASSNQYPLFDVYTVDSLPANEASAIFGYATSPDSDVNASVGLRIVHDELNRIFDFDQFLIEEDDGILKAWRDYSNQGEDLWYNPLTRELFFFNKLSWSKKTDMGGHYREAIISSIEPDAIDSAIEGLYWVDTLTNTIFKRVSSAWEIVTDVDVRTSDSTLQSIWRKGLNDEKYIPEKVDWRARSRDEYNVERDLFVEELAREIQLADSSVTESQATSQALTEWLNDQANPHSTTGIWVGDWEVPDPLYFNHLNENRKLINSRELLTHFTTIIDGQPRIPGYNGNSDSMFHLIPTNNVNYGIGGTIHEYNDSYDTAFSSTFVNNVTPITLFEFAHDQYESLLNNLEELFRRNAVEYFIDVSEDSLLNFSQVISAAVIDLYELNDSASIVYGDSTTFTDVDGADDLGVKNWIATLPYLKLLAASSPEKLVDPNFGLSQIIHHDGHRNDYSIERAVIEEIIELVINTLDERTRFPGPQDPPIDTFGHSSITSPPNNIIEFSNEFNTTINNREGVYWYHIPTSTDRTFYRLDVIEIGTVIPSAAFSDGTLWFDTAVGFEVLREKTTSNIGIVSWVPVVGNTIGDGRLHNGTDPSDVTTATASAWSVINLDEILADIILDLETRLYGNVPDAPVLRYDFDAIASANPIEYDILLEEAFLDYTTQSEITGPYLNNQYDATDPFTWNYKYSTPGILPSSENDGSESGGDWRDYYNKLYGTSFPHLEPWKLQGFIAKPTWWDAEYKNDEPLKWGIRRWKYTHGFEIVDVTDTNLVPDGILEAFTVDGDFREMFPTNTNFLVDESASHYGMYNVIELLPIDSVSVGAIGTSSIEFAGNVVLTMFVGLHFGVVNSSDEFVTKLTVKTSTFTGVNTIVVVEEEIADGTGFDAVGGATYDEAANRTIVRTDAVSLAPIVEGRIALAIGMWENIRIGNIKAGERYPNNVLSVTGNPTTDALVGGMPTYNYFSVNIDNDIITADGGLTNYEPDDVLPPYWDYVPQYSASVLLFDLPVRSVFFNFNTEISSPSIDYTFTDSGPVEFDWRISSQFIYDQLTVAYKIDPIRLITNTFGIDFIEIGNLQVDSRTERVLSHNRTDFHGEIVDNEVYKVDGTNQWYVNFNRLSGFDVSLSDFRALWTDWTAPLMYQMASFVDTDSISIGHRTVPLASSDYSIVAKRSPAIEDFWNDAFDVSVLTIPPKLIQYDTQADWRFEVSTNANRSRNVQYYGVHNYQFGIDIATDICTLYNWPVLSANTFADSITIANNQTETFVAGRTIEIANSTSNDGTYVIKSSVVDSLTNQTTIIIEEQLPSGVGDGDVTVQYRTMPWITGDSVYLSSTGLLPIPFEGDNVNGLYRYFIIVIDDTHFQLALTQQEAFDAINVSLTGVGSGDSFVGQILGTFTALNGERTSTLWRRYAIDKDTILSFATPHGVSGVQNFVNIIHGYDVFNYDAGWRINDENSETDFDTSRLVSWQVEIERFINTIYSLRTTRESVNDRYSVSVESTTNTWTFVDPNNHFITGDAVTVLVSGTLPSPLIQGLRYYIIRDTFDEFKLATNKLDAIKGTVLDITSTGSGDLYVLAARDITYSAPSIELNPARNGIWFRPERGIVSDVISGPTEDIREQQLLFDQYSRPLTLDQVRIFREDKRTQISIAQNLTNDVEIGSDTLIPYNHIHLGGTHLFIDTFEHVTVFNNYNSVDSLIYDPFIGLNLNKIEYDFKRQPEFTQRPNMGGFYFETFFNQNASLRRNIEANIEDLRYAYDTYNVQEENPFVKHSRAGLGYEGSTDYLDNLNLNDKSQFAFWRGMIQQKGSINAVNAFVNSRRFIDAKVDEFWAYKIADFGAAAELEYPELFVTTIDSRSNDFRMEFVTENNSITPEDDANGFVVIEGTDEERWFNQPDQVEILRDNGQNLYFDLEAQGSLAYADVNVEIDYGGTGTSATFKVDSIDHGTWSRTGAPTDPDNLPIFRHNFASSDIILTADYYAESHNVEFPGTIETEYTLTDMYVFDANSIRVFVDGVEKEKGLDWTEVIEATPISTKIEMLNSVNGADIVVLYQTSTLRPGIHFEHVTSNIIRMFTDDLIPGFTNFNFDFTIWAMGLNENAQNPARLIDTEAETVISSIQIWDPARGDHYFNSLHNIQLQNTEDMALYNNGTNSVLPQFGPWGNEQVGTTWLDTLELDYIPYYDNQAFPTIDDRLRLWGQLSSWGNGTIYEWVKSDIAPSAWDDVATSEEGDNSIPEAARKSGVARKVLFENTGTVPSPVWVPYRSIVRHVEVDAAIEGTDNLDGTFTFTLTNAPIAARGTADIYVNGLIVEENVTITPTVDTFDVTAPMGESDRLRVMEPDITQDDIDADEALKEDYQYSTFIRYDKLNNPHTDYYFWVGNKGTADRSGTRTLSAKVAMQQLITIPTSYMVTQKLLSEERIVTEPNTLLPRDEYKDAIVGQIEYNVGLIIAPSTIVNVFVDGFQVDSGDITVNTQSITLATPAVGGEIVEIEYTGLYDIATVVPLRFVQAIIRGLRGLVDDDRRYTIRFVRNFTLRDNLEDGTTALELKNHHEEWKIFREAQQHHIDRYLWDKITEAMVGYKLSDPSIRVPSLNRELYDTRYLTATQIGLRSGQKFTDGALAILTILADLQTPDNNFQPVDINVFFEDNNFDTPDDIITSMNKIYNTFPYEHVNRIYFSVLHDAFSFKDKYEDMFKTSMIALHGVRPFQVGGLLDD